MTNEKNKKQNMKNSQKGQINGPNAQKKRDNSREIRWQVKILI